MKRWNYKLEYRGEHQFFAALRYSNQTHAWLQGRKNKQGNKYKPYPKAELSLLFRDRESAAAYQPLLVSDMYSSLETPSF